jgi:hypothetical protein
LGLVPAPPFVGIELSVLEELNTMASLGVCGGVAAVWALGPRALKAPSVFGVRVDLLQDTVDTGFSFS